MKKVGKKGFTLVEVLAVIVVIGIIATIAIVAISRYVNDGKEDYNMKLKDELTLSAKDYFADNKDALPTISNGKSFAYVALPEMQSNNYISKSFVDSEKRECSPSYVYVRQKSYDSNDYIYVPCLICQDEKGENKVVYSDEPYCDVASWEDKAAPTCTNKTFNYGDGTEMLLEGVSDYKDIANTVKGTISTIIITNITNGDEYYIDAKKLTQGCETDHSGYESVEECRFKKIETINIKDYFERHFKTTADAEYEVRIVDEGMNVSDPCMQFSVIGENSCTATIEGKTLQINEATAWKGFAGLYMGPSSTKNILPSKYIEKKTMKNVSIKLEDTNFDPNPIIKDMEGNSIYCATTVIKPGEITCEVKDAPQNPINMKGYNVKVECSMCTKSACKDIQVNNINAITGDSLGEIGPGAVTYLADGKATNKGQKILFTIPYKPKTQNVSDGRSTLTFGEGVVINPSNNKPNAGQEIFIEVDAVPPKITIDTHDTTGSGDKICYEDKTANQKTLQADAYKGCGYKDKLKVTITCTDNGRTPQKFITKETIKKTASFLDNPFEKTYNTRGTYKFDEKCIDKANNETTKVFGPYRILKSDASCKACKPKLYKEKAAAPCDCKKYKMVKDKCIAHYQVAYTYYKCCAAQKTHCPEAYQYAFTTSCPEVASSCTHLNSAMSGMKAYGYWKCTGYKNGDCKTWTYKKTNKCDVYKKCRHEKFGCDKAYECYY